MVLRYAFVLLFSAAVFFPGGSAGAQIVLSLVYDNSPYKAGLIADVGFGCLIKVGGARILFDTGRDGAILLDNFRKMGERPEDVDVVVISHNHNDHTGGLAAILAVNPKIKVLTCELTPEVLIASKTVNAVVIKTENPTKLSRGVYLTGALGNGIKEQALFIDTQAGLIIVVGCSHPGILNVVEHVTNLLPKPVFLVIGVFPPPPGTPDGIQHMASRFRSLGVRHLAPCHCTDLGSKASLRSFYGKDYVEAGVGRVLRFPFKLTK